MYNLINYLKGIIKMSKTIFEYNLAKVRKLRDMKELSLGVVKDKRMSRLLNRPLYVTPSGELTSSFCDAFVSSDLEALSSLISENQYIEKIIPYDLEIEAKEIMTENQNYMDHIQE